MAIHDRFNFDPNGFPDYERKFRTSTCQPQSLGPLADQLTVGAAIDGYTAAQGTNFGRFRARPGDHYTHNNGVCYEDRLLGRLLAGDPGVDAARQNAPFVAGRASYFGWATLIPAQPAWPSGWFILGEIHGPGGIQAPYKWRLGGSGVELKQNAGAWSGSTYSSELPAHVLHPLELGVWWYYIFGVSWKTDLTGWYRQWVRRQGTSAWTQVVEQLNIATLQYPAGSPGSPYGLYPTLGIYRNLETAFTTTVYHDGWCWGDTFADVAAELGGDPGEPPPPPPAAAAFTGPWSATAHFEIASPSTPFTGPWSTTGHFDLVAAAEPPAAPDIELAPATWRT